MKTLPNSYTIQNPNDIRVQKQIEKRQEMANIQIVALGTQDITKYDEHFLLLRSEFLYLPVMTLIITYQRGLLAIFFPVTLFGRILLTCIFS